MDRILRMIMRRFMRQAINKGVDVATSRAARGTTREEDMTPEQRASVRQNQKRMRQMTNTARRMTRF